MDGRGKLLSLWEFRRPYCFDLGYRTYAALLNNKSENDLLERIIGKICLNPCLFLLKVCLVLFVALECSKFGASSLLKYLKTSNKSDQGCLRDASIGPMGVPPEVLNNRSRTKRATPGNNQTAPKWEPTSESLAYFG